MLYKECVGRLERGEGQDSRCRKCQKKLTRRKKDNLKIDKNFKNTEMKP